MTEHVTEAVVVHCIDFRLQEYLDAWLQENFGYGNFDRVSLAGAVKNHDVVLDQIKNSKKLHNIEKVVLISHEDCGAYGKDGNYDHHKKDLEKMERTIKKEFSKLKVEKYYLQRVDGKFGNLVKI